MTVREKIIAKAFYRVSEDGDVRYLMDSCISRPNECLRVACDIKEL